MTVYRARNKLAKGSHIIPRGATTTLHWLNEEQVQKMIDVGAVTVVPSLPLGKVPSFGWQASRLASVGYEEAGRFLSADTAQIAEALGYREKTIEKWKDDVRSALDSEEEYKG